MGFCIWRRNSKQLFKCTNFPPILQSRFWFPLLVFNSWAVYLFIYLFFVSFNWRTIWIIKSEVTVLYWMVRLAFHKSAHKNLWEEELRVKYPQPEAFTIHHLFHDKLKNLKPSSPESYLNIFILGGSASRSKPVPFQIPFLTEIATLSYTLDSYRKWFP